MFFVCSFCGDRPVVAWFEGPDFRRSVDSPEKVTAEEAWLACSHCLDLVGAGDRDGLIERAKDRRETAADAVNLERTIRESHERFWLPRSA